MSTIEAKDADGRVGQSTPKQDSWVAQVLGLNLGGGGGEVSGGEAGGRPKKPRPGGMRLAAPPELPVPRASLGPAQKERCDKLLAAMSPADQNVVKNLLVKAKGEEKAYLQKALASKHSAAELVTFQKAIAGKDNAWMEKNLHVVGEADGKGIKQQWRDSCGPTTVQAMMGELDPIYALKLRTENPNLDSVDGERGTALNPKAAAEQKTMLENNGGAAVARNSTEQVAGKKYGMPLGDALNSKSGSTGLKFTPTAVDPANVDASLTTVDAALNGGLPVPVRVTDGSAGHFVLVTGVDEGPPRRYSIHDPWEGKTIVVTDKQIKDKSFRIAGHNQISHFYAPSPAAGP